MSEFDQTLGLDASDYFQSVDRIISKNKALESSTVALGRRILESMDSMNNQILIFRNLERQSQSFNANLRLLGAEYHRVDDSLRINNVQLAENLRLWKAVQLATEAEYRSLQKVAGRVGAPRVTNRSDSFITQGSRSSFMSQDVDAQIKFNQLEAERLATKARLNKLEQDAIKLEKDQLAVVEAEISALKRKEQELSNAVKFQLDFEAANKRIAQQQAAEDSRRQAVLRQQREQFNQLQTAAAQEQRSLGEAQISLTRQLQAAHNRVLETQRQEALAAQRTLAADQLRAQLLRSFVGPTPATANEVSRVTQNIGNITRLVSQGQVSLARAMEIVQAVQSGSASAFEGVENQVARSARSMIQASNSLGTSYNRNLTSIEASNARLRRSLRGVGDEAERNSRRILLGWRDLVRIFTVQSIHTALGVFIADLRQSINEAATFQVRISEIRTISQDAQLSFGRWAANTRALSDEFGNPLLDVAAGVYETISNQIARGADASIFMHSALQLAQSAVSTTAESVNTLSSVLNSYQMSSDRAGYVSGVLFKLVDLGRVRLGELGNTFGRTTALAAPLGVSLEEVSAAIATLTIRGVKYNEAYTLINNVLVKLLNPTREMSKFLNDLGFANGEAAIAALGFEGVLKKIETATKGNVAEIADLFNEMRALRGAVGLTGSAFQNFQSNLEKIKNAGESYNIAKQLIPESAGKQFQIEMTRIRNIFVEDFGGAFIKTLVDLTSSYDENGRKVRGLADTVKTLVSVLTAAGAAYISFRAIQLATSAATQAYNFVLRAHAISARAAAMNIRGVTTEMVLARNIMRGLSGVANPFVLLSAGIGAATFLWMQHNQTLQEVIQGYQGLDATVAASVEEQTRNIRAEIDKQQRIFKDGLDRRFRFYLTYGASIRSTLNKLAEDEEKKQAEVVAHLKDVFDVARKEIEKTISGTEKQISSAARNIEILQKRLDDLKDGLIVGRFERQIKGLPEEKQIDLFLNRLRELRKERDGLLATRTGNAVSDQRNIERSLRVSAEIEKIVNELYDRRAEAEKKRKEVREKISELETKENNREDIRETSEQLLQLSQLEARIREARQKGHSAQIKQLEEQKRQLQLLKQQQSFDEQSRQAEAEIQKLKLQEETYDKMLKILGTRESQEKDLLQDYKDQVAELNKQLQIQKDLEKTASERLKKQQKDLETAKTIFQELTSKFKLPSEADFKKGKGFDGLKTFDDKVKQLSTLGITDPNVFYDIAKRRAEIEKQLFIENEKFKNEEATKSIEKLKQESQKAYDEIQQSISDAIKKRETGAASIEQTVKLLDKLGGISDSKIEFLRKTLNELRAGNFNPDEVNDLGVTKRDVLKGVFESIAAAAGGRDRFLQAKDRSVASDITVGDLVDKLRLGISQMIGAGRDLPELQQKRAQAEQKLNEALNKQGPQGTKFIDAVDSSTRSLAQLESNVNNVVNSLQQAQNRINRLFPNASPAKGFETGGYIMGGVFRPRGADRIPAMLAPGEYVVRSSATARYRSLLDRINNGGTLYMNEGGFVPNIAAGSKTYIGSQSGDSYTYGDTHINLYSSGNTQTDISAIARELNSGIRRGTIKLRRR